MNLRKITSLVIALALLLVPSLSLGESAAAAFEQKALDAGRSLSTTVTFVPGDFLSQDSSMSMIADVLKILSIKTSCQKDSENTLGSFSMNLQDQPALSFTALKKGEEFHLMSNLLGDSVLSFTPEEFAQLYFTLTDEALSAAEKSGMAADQLAALKAQMDSYKSMMTGIIAAKTSGADTEVFAMPFKLPEFNQESLQADLVAPITAWATGIMSTPQTTTGTFESEKYDTATTQAVYSISADQIQQLMQIVSDWAAKEDNFNTIVNFLSSASAGTNQLKDEDKATLLQKIKDLPATFAKEAAPSMKQPVTLTVMTDDKGNTPAMEIKGLFTGTDAAASDVNLLVGIYSKTEGSDVTSTFTLDAGTAADALRLSFSNKAPADGTPAKAKAWKFEAGATENGTETFSIALDFTGEENATETTADDTWKLGINLNAGGMPISVTLDSKSAATFDGKDVKKDAALTVSMTGMEGPVLTINTSTVSGDPVAYPEVPADSVRLGKMTMEELNTWSQAAMQTAMTSLMSAMQYLPESVLTLFTGTPAAK
jgi:hypothetical protein